MKKDVVLAAVNYVRAVRLESGRAGMLLWKLVQTKDFYLILKKEVDVGNHDAQYAWAGLSSLGLDHQLTDGEALGLLEAASEGGNVQALIELGLCYYSGRWVAKDRAKAMECWDRASARGSEEARLRIIVAQLKGENKPQVDSTVIASLNEYMNKGSILAQVALAYCYEEGKGPTKNKGTAAHLYRGAAARGSLDAMNSLKRMHDKIRPPGKEFSVAD
jgi:TPR repeat protein